MLPVIDKCRELTPDLPGANMVLTQQQVQDALDESRFDVRYELLVAAPTITNTLGVGNPAVFVWIDYYSKFQYWEVDGSVAQWGDFTLRNPVQTEFINGHWKFSYLLPDGTLPPNADTPGQYPPIFVTGRAYDIYAGAIKVLRLLKARLLLTTYDFDPAQGMRFLRSQIIKNIDTTIADYGRMLRPRQVQLSRSDSAHPYVIDVPVLLSGMNDKLP